MTHFRTSLICRSALSSPAYWSLNLLGSSSGRGATSARAGVFAAQHEVHEHLRRVRMRGVLHYGEERRLRADTAGLETELRDRHGAQAVLDAPRPAEHGVELAARHLAGLVEAEELGLEPGELADERFAVLLGVHVLQAVDMVDADVGDARIGERHTLALDQVDPVRVTHEVPVALGVLVRGDQLRVDVQTADAREHAGEMRLLVYDGPAPLHVRVERRRRDEVFREPAPRQR